MKLRKGQSSKRKEDSSKWRKITFSLSTARNETCQKNVPVYIRGLGEGSEGGSPHPLLPDPKRRLGEGSEGGVLHPFSQTPGEDWG